MSGTTSTDRAALRRNELAWIRAHHAQRAESACRRGSQVAFVQERAARTGQAPQSDPVVVTAGGLTSGIDLALHVVSRYFGQGVAQRTADDMEYEGTGWKR